MKKAKILGILQIFTGMASVAGGLPMIFNPESSAINYPEDLLYNTSFSSLLIPAIILVFVVGGSQLLGAYLSLNLKRATAIFGIISELSGISFRKKAQEFKTLRRQNT